MHMRKSFGRQSVALFSAFLLLAVGLQPAALASGGAGEGKDNVVYNAGYYETTALLTKHVGETYTPKTTIDGVAAWVSSDPSVAKVNSYANTGASISFLKVGEATVTFTNTYTYVQPVFEQTGTVTGIWHAERRTGMTIVHLKITVKEAIGTSLFAGGNGSSASPYLISTKKQLANMNELDNLNSYFKLTNNIAFSPEDFQPGGAFYNDGHGWFPIGTLIAGKGQPFRGVFDGNGYVVSGLQSRYNLGGTNGMGFFGLFGVNSYGIIKNLGVENSVFLGYSDSDDPSQLEYVGGIAGSNVGTISNCYVANCLLGGNSAGGIVGDQERFLNDCYSYNNSFAVVVARTADANKGFTWGGIAGDVNTEPTGATPTIYDCYTADLSFSGWTGHSGAIAGTLLENTTIKDCYYNNTDVNAFSHRSGTTSYKLLTTDAMQKQASFPALNFASTWTIGGTADYKYPTLKVFHPFEEALYVTTLPKKTVYLIGSELDLAGGRVSYTNSDGKTQTYSMTDDLFSATPAASPTEIKGTISGVNLSTPGEKIVTVSYMGQTAQFPVYVVDAKLASTLKISCAAVPAGSSPAPKVVQNDSQAAVTYRYYSDANCTKAIAKPTAAGTYYVKATTPETDVYKAASSAAVRFSIARPTALYAVTAKSANAYGTVSGSGSVASGTSITVKAVPKAGYRFAGWKEGTKTVSTSANYTFKVTAPRTLSATFAKIGTPSVKAASAGYNGVKLTWPVVTGAGSYEIYRATSKTGKYTLAGTSTGTSYTGTGLTAGKVYYFKVRVKCIAGSTATWGGYSAIVSAKPVPAAPGSIKAARASASSVKVSWGKVAGATKYELCYATSKTGVYKKSGETGAASYTVKGLKKGKTYYFKVRAYRLVGKAKVPGSYSSVVSAKP